MYKDNKKKCDIYKYFARVCLVFRLLGINKLKLTIKLARYNEILFFYVAIFVLLCTPKI